MEKPQGFLTISSIRSPAGDIIPPEEARKRGWLVGEEATAPEGWGIGENEIPLGHNLFVDTGRQCVANLLGGLSPASNNQIVNFGAGTGLIAPTTLDVQLNSPLTFSNNSLYKAVDSCAFPVPYVLQVSITIDAASMNGYLITEFGLFTANNTMIAHWVKTNGYNKTSDSSPTFTWSIRM